MGKLAAGSLNRQVEIQRKTVVDDEGGQPVPTWKTFAKPWVNFKTITGSAAAQQEFVTGDIEIDRVTTSIRMRFRTDIDATMRVLYRGEVYDIKAVLPDEEFQEYMDLAVAKGASQG